MVALLDVDYQNTDFPDEALHHPGYSFGHVESLFRSVRQELRAFGIDHIAVMTGQGYRFAWRISDGSIPECRLRKLTDLPATLEAKYRHDHPLLRALRR